MTLKQALLTLDKARTMNRINPREEATYGYLEVDNDGHDIIVRRPDHNIVPIVFSPCQARNFAALLLRHADEIETADEY